MYVRTYRNSINKCTTMIPTAVPWDFFYSKYYSFWNKIWRQFGNYSVPSFILSTSSYIKIKTMPLEERSKLKKTAHFSLVSLSPRPRARRGAARIRQGEGHWSRPPKTALEQSDLTEKLQFRESHTEPETIITADQIPVPSKNESLYIHIDIFFVIHSPGICRVCLGSPCVFLLLLYFQRLCSVQSRMMRSFQPTSWHVRTYVRVLKIVGREGRG